MAPESCGWTEWPVSIALFLDENLTLEKGPTDKAKDTDPGGSDQQNLGYKKLKNRKADRTVGFIYSSIQPYGQPFCFSVFSFLGATSSTFFPTSGLLANRLQK